MGHPTVENRTPFVLEVLHLVDEECRPLVVPVLKGTFTILPDGRCARADEQLPLNLAGENHGKDPETSSFKYEPEVAFVKPSTDVVLIGHAYARSRGTREMQVALGVGPVTKTIAVFGDRNWFRTMGLVSKTDPAPFEKIPLVYERAFGGWDRRDPDPEKHLYEPRNPVGVGFIGPLGVDGQSPQPLPNLEDPATPITKPTQRPAPAGFGFIGPHWQPRAALAGTYDEAWQKSRAPLLPKDFDRRHLNAASPGLVAPEYLRGNEKVVAAGVTPDGTLKFSLPGYTPPPVRIGLVDGPTIEVSLNLDTVIIEPDEHRVMILWRGMHTLRTGPHDVTAVEMPGDLVPR